jgi:anti-anti-sigma regulatory factor
MGEITVVVDVSGVAADLDLVDDLARIRLEARRRGCAIRLRGSSRSLRGLLALCGLGGLLLEEGGEPECGEELAIDEARDLGDLPA